MMGVSTRWILFVVGLALALATLTSATAPAHQTMVRRRSASLLEPSSPALYVRSRDRQDDSSTSATEVSDASTLATGSQASSTSNTSSSSSASSTSSAGDDEPSHTGKSTHYKPDLGACGKRSDSSDLVVALSSSMYGTKSSGKSSKSSNCGRKLRATYNGNSVDVTVVDRCADCGDEDLDLSPAAFEKLAPLGKGLLHNVKWTWLTDS